VTCPYHLTCAGFSLPGDNACGECVTRANLERARQRKTEQLKELIAWFMAPYPHGSPHPETVDMFAQGLLDAIEVSNSRPAEYADEPWIGQPSVKHATHCLRHVTRARISLFSATIDWPEMICAFEPSQRPTWLADDGTPELAHAVVRGMMGLWQWRKETKS